MHLDIIDHPEDPALGTFYAAYRLAFVLPNETEELTGFQACLALNHGEAHARLRAEYGPFREVCIIARDTPGGTMVGGANLIALRHDLAGQTMLTANLNYIFVPAPARGRGWFPQLLQAVTAAVPDLLRIPSIDAAAALVFIEQNDPLRMEPDDYASESAHSGIDQFDRLRIWAARNARVVDFPYVQPALSRDQSADDGLVYSVIGASGPMLDSCLLASHLRGFFGISVLKGASLVDDASVTAQLDALAQACRQRVPIPLLDPSHALKTLDADAERALVQAGPGSLRDWLRAHQSSNVA
ncbi:hypothetical protein [Dyella lutea]|uniref:N-acetyltransferase domain-containing protein n=1 Tax=Dyella lutea TaxID=2950441 RepID=A0ABT1FI43_9GAMM|nr:hypothetical protein [Dyella lutea]MCP1375798.1 hypothetical protein [Dyella lutea]